MQTIETKRESVKEADLVLVEDLERRYGPGMAQDIMDQLKKAENPGASKGRPTIYRLRPYRKAKNCTAAKRRSP